MTLFAENAMRKILSDERFCWFENVLDIGSGPGYHADIMRRSGKTVTTIDINGNADITDNFMNYYENSSELFSAIWASHVLEHQLDIHGFLKKCRSLLYDGGVLAITVPPAKHEIVGGHLSIWNAGLLLYNLVVAGFDCSQAAVSQYGYNISVILRKKEICLPPLRYDHGDLDTLAKYFPEGARGERFNGDIRKLNWEL